MADSTEREQDEQLDTAAADQAEGGEATATEEKQKLQLDVAIEKRSACERHITVKVARDDIERYFGKEFDELMPSAQVPGFRPGRAPRKLVESRFRKQIGDKVKTELLMDSLGQLHDEHELSAISEPNIELDAVDLPEEGPLTFEFDLEVRPEFDLPQWKGLSLEKPTREISDKDVTDSLTRLLENRGRLAPHEGAAEAGDFITANVTFKRGDEVVSTAQEVSMRLRPTLSLQDGRVEKFDERLAGVRGGESRTLQVAVSADAEDESLRSQTLDMVVEVLDVKRLQTAELSPELLEDLGGFKLEADLRDAIKDTLTRRLDYEQRQRTRQQISNLLTEAASWELPPGLLQRQSRRELQRAVMELQRSGFSDEDIRTHENQLRQNSRASTTKALKEHFILERIAEDQKIDADEADYEMEIALIARQSGESPRRVRARLEKGGAMDVLRNQIIERKVVDLIMEHAQFKPTPYTFEETDTEALDLAVSRVEADIPDAKPGGEAAAPGGKPAEPHLHT